MRRTESVVLAALAAIVLLPPTGTAQAPTDEFTVGGLKVIVRPNTANEVVSARLYIRGGVMNLEEATQGIEPLLFLSALRGSERYPKEVLNGILDRTAASITGSVSWDYSVVSLRTVKNDFAELWEVFADVVMHPALEPQEVELVRENLLSDIAQRVDDADDFVRDVASALYYEGHPYRLRPGGVTSSVSQITIEQLRAHHERIFQTSNLLLVVVGDVDRDGLAPMVAATLGTLPRGEGAAPRPAAVWHEASGLRTAERELPTTYVLGLFDAPRLGHPDYHAMRVAMSVLGARVWEEVRTKRGLSYAPAAFLFSDFASRNSLAYGWPGVAGLYVTAVDPDTTVRVMLAELRRMQQEPVVVKDVRDRIAMYLTGYFLSNETNASQAAFLARYELAGSGWRAAEAFVDGIRSVTGADIQRVAQTYFRNLQFGVVGSTAVDPAAFAF